MTSFNSILILTVIMFFSLIAQAHPVPFKGATAIMTWNQIFMTDNWVVHSMKSDVAIAARHMRLEMPDGRMDFYGPQFNYLLKRWNELDSQSNIYIYGAYGMAHFMNQSDTAGQLGIELDSETRKYYLALKYEKMWTQVGPDMDRIEARIGIAPYEAEFKELASWFMIQYQRHPLLTKKQAVTPLIRLFYRSVLLETGVSMEGDWMINTMFHF